MKIVAEKRIGRIDMLFKVIPVLTLAFGGQAVMDYKHKAFTMHIELNILRWDVVLRVRIK